MAAKIKAKFTFVGRFPGTTTDLQFNANLPEGGAIFISAPLVKIFRQVMAETYPDLPQRPALRKLTITITFP